MGYGERKIVYFEVISTGGETISPSGETNSPSGEINSPGGEIILKDAKTPAWRSQACKIHILN